ncbi:NADP-dependent oxidoreductase [Brachybacterium sp. EF45031]|uniref:NADP-dependent oxidoreductase n=1 Tax=Brachybacterium sillae TaxID=2810536 RepID=UPI00217CE95B|nr:NADP-dependent oxidoreductase [Brachybacterium sillae]MCS6712017.1 NADP-dependent oxidoreductase [Brachybacterium sillae]
MKAVTYAEYGIPEDVLTITEVPVPKVGAGEVRIAVKAAAVNPVDWKIMAGYLDGMTNVQWPVIPGWDVAGVIEAVGTDVPDYQVGDEVMAYGRKDWLSQGSFAEKMTLPVRTLARKPASLSWEQAAALPLAGLTAFQTLRRLGVGEGDTVLIHGASGGVGSYGVQIARALGARVIGAASEARQDRVREFGGEPVVYGDGLVEQVRALAPEGVTVVADYAGGAVEQTVQVLAEGGRHGSIADPSVVGHGGESMWVHPDHDDLAELGAMVERGQIRVDLAHTLPLERAAEAYRMSFEGRAGGKIAITVAGA